MNENDKAIVDVWYQGEEAMRQLVLVEIDHAMRMMSVVPGTGTVALTLLRAAVVAIPLTKVQS
jgi:hypothetical protein